MIKMKVTQKIENIADNDKENLFSPLTTHKGPELLVMSVMPAVTYQGRQFSCKEMRFRRSCKTW